MYTATDFATVLIGIMVLLVLAGLFFYSLEALYCLFTLKKNGWAFVVSALYSSGFLVLLLFFLVTMFILINPPAPMPVLTPVSVGIQDPLKTQRVFIYESYQLLLWLFLLFGH